MSKVIHFKVILTIETLSDMDQPHEIFDRIRRQVFDDMVLDCQTIDMELSQYDTTDPTMPMGPNGNSRID